MDGPLPLQARTHLFGITFDIYARRDLTDAEAKHAIASFIAERREGLVRLLYSVISDTGQDDEDSEAQQTTDT